MAKSFLPTVETLRKQFAYDPHTGIVSYLGGAEDYTRTRVTGHGSKAREMEIGQVMQVGMPAEEMVGASKYLHVRLFGKKLPAHRVAWALHYGEWPSGRLDHINRDPHDNRIDNLRIATAAQNARNRTSAYPATSQYLGVCKVKGGKWRAQIAQGNTKVHLGEFDDERDAALAYDCAAISMHREFAAPNIVENPYLTRRRK